MCSVNMYDVRQIVSMADRKCVSKSYEIIFRPNGYAHNARSEQKSTHETPGPKQKENETEQLPKAQPKCGDHFRTFGRSVKT